MASIEGKVHSVYSDHVEDDLGKMPCASLQAELDGLVGDRHRSIECKSWGASDK
jgi:hypothetical protein